MQVATLLGRSHLLGFFAVDIGRSSAVVVVTLEYKDLPKVSDGLPLSAAAAADVLEQGFNEYSDL